MTRGLTFLERTIESRRSLSADCTVTLSVVSTSSYNALDFRYGELSSCRERFASKNRTPSTERADGAIATPLYVGRTASHQVRCGAAP